MPFTIRDLLRVPALDLRPLAAVRRFSNPIRWVHVSELEDPTPWLKGGELLLTTGMGIGKSQAQQRRYVARLADAGLAGLGFGVGFSFQRVPKAFVDAAERSGFPLFEVPYPVPFIAITEAVFTRLVTEQYDILSRSLEAEHTLTRAVLDGRGSAGIVTALAKATGGWALALDLHGSVVAGSPDSARPHLSTVWEAIAAGRDAARFGVSLVSKGHHVWIQPVAAQGRIEAYLALGKREPLSQFDRIVSSHALSLLAIELSKIRAVSETERRLKGDLLEQLLAGRLRGAAARAAVERLGFDAELPFVAVALAGPNEGVLAAACEETLVRRAMPFLLSTDGGVVTTVLQPAGGGFLGELRAEIAARAGGTVTAGSGRPVPVDDLARAAREAQYALQVCRSDHRLQAEFADLGTYQLLLSLQDPEALRTFSSSVLEPLDRYDAEHGGELLPSLRAFLERNARWEAAAADLYVHRHTLRYRMRKVEELTGRDLDSARDRMEFFLALRARELLALSDGGDGDVEQRGSGRAQRRGSAVASGRRLAATYNEHAALSPLVGPRRKPRG